jgi:raffinose/stachyose/melibiose transport system substrate-binding protein
MTRFRKTRVVSAALLAIAAAASAAKADVTLTVESWRSEDAEIWNKTLIPAFEKTHPGIKVVFTPTQPIQYDASIQVKLAAGSAGDIIGCRAFDAVLDLDKKGYLLSVKDLPGIENFPTGKLVGFQTDDGSDTFCFPFFGTLHGFIYNKDIFDELGLKEPQTWDEFYALLDKIKADGRYVPLDIGTKDTWTIDSLGYLNIGPQFWKGEEGRKSLIRGEKKFTDPEFVEPWKQLAKWAPYLAPGFQAQGYSDSQSLFTLGRAAIYPSGSWEISGFRKDGNFQMGAFKVPVTKVGDKCYVTDHVDMGMGINAKTQHPEEAKKFLEWMSTPVFTQLLADALPGLYPLTKFTPQFKDPLATTFASWRGQCESTIRVSFQILSRGTPNLDNELGQVSANVVGGTQTPEAAGKQVQAHLDAWYHPAKQ